MANSKSSTLDERFLNLMMEAMADGVFTLNDKGMITSWNRAMERITGYTAREAMGRGCSMLNFNQCFNKSCPASVFECGIFKKGAVDGKECMLHHKDGYNVPVLKSARVVKDDEDNIIGVVETVTDLTELQRSRNMIVEVKRKLGEIYQFNNIIGKSHAMQRVFSAIQSASASDATVLISGESGTGKELVAGAIHFTSNRSEKPFVTINCSALSESLLESELFGHVKGAYTGAIKDRPGRFEEADGGTLFLDEIGDISPYIQVKLLRVLQEREIERVGESKKRKIDIRIITASNKDLYGQVHKGEFREDLYYRLKVFPVHIPPLRDRKEDIHLLCHHFVNIQNQKTGKTVKDISSSAMRVLMDHPWPGNVRELQNAIEHAFVLLNDDAIDLGDLPIELRRTPYSYASHNEKPRLASTGQLTKEVLLKTLGESGWNKAEAGRRLGRSRTAIWKHMKKWNIPLQQDDLTGA
ncbi:MAG: sigma 54-interacting transcriptional regulator [Proteobacteria bacterium]|nr:sigma 54-interacting transcriptional regulator [Pseudomonadota bacterium]